MSKNPYRPQNPEEQKIWNFYELSYNRFKQLLSKDVKHPKFLDWDNVYVKFLAGIKRTKGVIPFLQKSDFAIVASYQMLLTSIFESILKHESVYEYVLSYEEAAKKYRRCSNPKPQEIEIGKISFSAIEVEQNFLSERIDSTLRQIPFGLTAVILKRAVLGLLDLSILLAAKSRDEKKFSPLVHPLKQKLKDNIDAQEKLWEFSETMRKRSNRPTPILHQLDSQQNTKVIKPFALMKDNQIFLQSIGLQLYRALSYEPNIFFIEFINKPLMFTTPVISKIQPDVLDFLTEAKKIYFRPRENILLKRTLLLFQLSDTENLMRDKLGKFLLSKFLVEKGITNTELAEPKIKTFLNYIA